MLKARNKSFCAALSALQILDPTYFSTCNLQPADLGPFYRSQSPTTIVKTVSGKPTLKYSQNEMETRLLDFCNTIKLATDPSTVRFPAKVEAIARIRQA
jgi:hypothetical protein